MTTRRADYPCVLPGDPTWIHDARYVQDILNSLAAAAAIAHDHGDPEKYVLPHLPYQVAADTLGQIRSDMPPARPGVLFLMPLPAFQLEALWQALDVLRRAQDADADTDQVLDLVHDYATHCLLPPRSIDDVVTDTERILAVPSLDTPAVRTVATTLLLKGEHDDGFRSPRDELLDTWRAAGIKP
ncbi:hypothetical protein ACIBL5_34365 [Streptomyces sp. NPDC050516]|uniref:hypothetical protein n=1 Tax=Streptomyces sp. NPDC050516 TaxID=3365621 RepID=UPI003796D672